MGHSTVERETGTVDTIHDHFRQSLVAPCQLFCNSRTGQKRFPLEVERH